MLAGLWQSPHDCGVTQQGWVDRYQEVVAAKFGYAHCIEFLKKVCWTMRKEQHAHGCPETTLPLGREGGGGVNTGATFNTNTALSGILSEVCKRW